MDSAPIIIFVFVTKQIDKMCKSSIFFGQQVYRQLKNVEMGRNHGGERCIKSFDGGSTLSDANPRRSEKYFEDVYRDLYEANKK